MIEEIRERNLSKTLRRYDVNENLFDAILDTMESRIQVVDGKLDKYYNGYQPKEVILYDGYEYMIIQEHILAYFADFDDDEYECIDNWRQVILRRCRQDDVCRRSIDGSRAYLYIKNLLLKHYSKIEYDERLHKFESDKTETNKQFHFTYPSKEVVRAHSNSIKYDLNAAHHDALIEIFPAAEDDLIKLYRDRKTNPLYKCYINYYVGMLARKGYRRTYNWIVARTTEKLKAGIEAVGGDLIYANTDGFIVSNPTSPIPDSREIGDFKIEFEGTAYTYQGDNYWLYQCGTEITGSIRYQVRDKIDLSRGHIVHYEVLKQGKGKRDKIINVWEEDVDVYQES